MWWANASSSDVAVFTTVGFRTMALLAAFGLPSNFDRAEFCPEGMVEVDCEVVSLWPQAAFFDTVLCHCEEAPWDWGGGALHRMLWILAALVACLASAYAIRPWFSPEFFDRPESFLAGIMVKWSRQPRIRARVVRSLFSSSDLVASKSALNHTHGASAAARSKASSEMKLLADELGLRAHFYQQSPSDQKLGREGSRSYYWAKDLAAERRAPDPNAEFFAMVDVDYYVDMPAFLANHAVPVCMYTFNPSCVAKSTGEYSFTFNVDNEVEYSVSGGAEYKHRVWNYGTDVVIAEKCSWGFWRTSVVYNVDRRQVDQDHQMVLLTPIARSAGLFPLSWFVSGAVLKRLSVCEPVQVDGEVVNFTRLDLQTASGLMRSTGVAGQHVCATIPAALDDTIQLQSCLNKVDLTLAQVKTTIETSDTAIAAVLVRYHRAACPHKPDTVYPVQQSVTKFEFYPKNYDPDSKAAVVPFMSPLSLGSCVPTICKSNDEQSIKGRVLGVATPELTISGTMIGHVEEFARFLVPDRRARTGHPVDQDEVFERQSRPAQRRILDEAAALGGLSHQPVSSFMKKESYAKVTDPRNISIIPGRNKLGYSAFVYAFSALLKETDWYAFGKTPIEIAQRVADICSGAQVVSMTDLSRCDGRVSNLLRALERVVMMRFFNQDYHEELLELLGSQFKQTAYTSTGMKYATGYSRLSGSPETADFNSFGNAFIAYITFRRLGYSAEESWKRLGLYGGDDGITADCPSVPYAASAALVGQVLECEEAVRGRRGVNFLSRYYSPFVWEGGLDSMCDAKRQIIKLHLTGSLGANVTPLMKLREKMRGFYLTDANTPVVGRFARVVTEMYGQYEGDDRLRGVASYWAKEDASVQFPNENVDGWMDEEFEQNFPGFDRSRFERWADRVSKNEAHPLAPPLCFEGTSPVKPPEDVVVDGDVVPKQVEKSSPSVSKPEQSEQKYPEPGAPEKQACKHYAAGKCTYGAKCRFTHVGSVPQAKAPCGLFIKFGSCRFGESCKFSHEAKAAARL